MPFDPRFTQDSEYSYDPYAVEDQPSQLGAAVDNTQATVYSGVEAAARMAGYDDIQNWAQQNAQKNLELAEKYKTDSPQRIENIKSVKGALGWAGDAIVNTAPQMLGMMGAGVAGSLVAGPIGAAVGAISSVAPMHLGEAYNKQVELDKYDPSALLTATAINTGLEAVPVAKFMKVAGGLGGGTFAKAIATGVVSEGPIEAVQGGVVDYAAGINPSLDADYVSARLNELAAGSVVGASMGGAGHVAGTANQLRKDINNSGNSAYDYLRNGVEGAGNLIHDGADSVVKGAKNLTGFDKYDSPADDPQFNKPGMSTAEDEQSIRQQIAREGFAHPNQMDTIENSDLDPEQQNALLDIDNREYGDPETEFSNPLDQLAYELSEADDSNLSVRLNSQVKRLQDSVNTLEETQNTQSVLELLRTTAAETYEETKTVDPEVEALIQEAQAEIDASQADVDAQSKLDYVMRRKQLFREKDYYNPAYPKDTGDNDKFKLGFDKLVTDLAQLPDNIDLPSASETFLTKWEDGVFRSEKPANDAYGVKPSKDTDSDTAPIAYDLDFLNEAVVAKIAENEATAKVNSYKKSRDKFEARLEGDYGNDRIAQLAHSVLTNNMSENQAYYEAEEIHPEGATFLDEKLEYVAEDMKKNAAIRDQRDLETQQQLEMAITEEGSSTPDQLYDRVVERGGALRNIPALNKIADDLMGDDLAVAQNTADNLKLDDYQAMYVERRLELLEQKELNNDASPISDFEQNQLEAGLSGAISDPYANEDISEEEALMYQNVMENSAKTAKVDIDSEGERTTDFEPKVKSAHTGYKKQYIAAGSTKDDGTKWEDEIDYLVDYEAEGIPRKNIQRNRKERVDLLNKYNTSEARTYDTQPLLQSIKDDMTRKERYRAENPSEVSDTRYSAKPDGKYGVDRTQDIESGEATTAEERLEDRIKTVAADILATRTNTKSDLYKLLSDTYQDGKNPEGVLNLFSSIVSTPVDSAVGSGEVKLDYQDKLSVEKDLLVSEDYKTDTSKVSAGFVPLKNGKQLDVVKAAKLVTKQIDSAEGWSPTQAKEAVASVVSQYIEDIDTDRVDSFVTERTDEDFVPSMKNSANFREIHAILSDMVARAEKGDKTNLRLPLKLAELDTGYSTAASTAKEKGALLNEAILDDIRDIDPNADIIRGGNKNSRNNPAYLINLVDNIVKVGSDKRAITDTLDVWYDMIDVEQVLSDRVYYAKVISDIISGKNTNPVLELKTVPASTLVDGNVYPANTGFKLNNHDKKPVTADSNGKFTVNILDEYKALGDNARVLTQVIDKWGQYISLEQAMPKVEYTDVKKKKIDNVLAEAAATASWKRSDSGQSFLEYGSVNKTLSDQQKTAGTLAKDSFLQSSYTEQSKNMYIASMQKELKRRQELIELGPKVKNTIGSRTAHLYKSNWDSIPGVLPEATMKADSLKHSPDVTKSQRDGYADWVKYSPVRMENLSEITELENRIYKAISSSNYDARQETLDRKDIDNKLSPGATRTVNVAMDNTDNKKLDLHGEYKDFDPDQGIPSKQSAFTEVNQSLTEKDTAHKKKRIASYQKEIRKLNDKLTSNLNKREKQAKGSTAAFTDEDIKASTKAAKNNAPIRRAILRKENAIKKLEASINKKNHDSTFDNVEEVNTDDINYNTFEYQGFLEGTEATGETESALTKQEEYAIRKTGGDLVGKSKLKARNSAYDRANPNSPEQAAIDEALDIMYTLMHLEKSEYWLALNKFTDPIIKEFTSIEEKMKFFERSAAFRPIKLLREQLETVRKDINGYTTAKGKKVLGLKDKKQIAVDKWHKDEKPGIDEMSQFNPTLEKEETASKKSASLKSTYENVKLADIDAYRLSVANKYIGHRNTQLRKHITTTAKNMAKAMDAKLPINETEGYGKKDLVFVDIPYNASNAVFSAAFSQALAAIKAGATILTPSTKYLDDMGHKGYSKLIQGFKEFAGYSEKVSSKYPYVSGWAKIKQPFVKPERATSEPVELPMYYPIGMNRSAITEKARALVPHARYIKDLLESGARTASTRAKKSLVPVGQTFTVDGVPGEYLVTEHRQVGPSHGVSWKQWSDVEGWTPASRNSFFKTHTSKGADVIANQARDGSWQMLFEKVVEAVPISEKDIKEIKEKKADTKSYATRPVRPNFVAKGDLTLAEKPFTKDTILWNERFKELKRKLGKEIVKKPKANVNKAPGLSSVSNEEVLKTLEKISEKGKNPSWFSKKGFPYKAVKSLIAKLKAFISKFTKMEQRIYDAATKSVGLSSSSAWAEDASVASIPAKAKTIKIDGYDNELKIHAIWENKKFQKWVIQEATTGIILSDYKYTGKEASLEYAKEFLDNISSGNKKEALQYFENKVVGKKDKENFEKELAKEKQNNLTMLDSVVKNVPPVEAMQKLNALHIKHMDEQHAVFNKLDDVVGLENVDNYSQNFEPTRIPHEMRKRGVSDSYIELFKDTRKSVEKGTNITEFNFKFAADNSKALSASPENLVEFLNNVEYMRTINGEASGKSGVTAKFYTFLYDMFNNYLDDNWIQSQIKYKEGRLKETNRIKFANTLKAELDALESKDLNTLLQKFGKELNQDEKYGNRPNGIYGNYVNGVSVLPDVQAIFNKYPDVKFSKEGKATYSKKSESETKSKTKPKNTVNEKVTAYIKSLDTLAKVEYAAAEYKKRGNDAAVKLLRTRYKEIRNGNVEIETKPITSEVLSGFKEKLSGFTRPALTKELGRRLKLVKHSMNTAEQTAKIEKEITAIQEMLEAGKKRLSSTGKGTSPVAASNTRDTVAGTQAVAQRILAGTGIKVKVVDGSLANNVAKSIGVSIDDMNSGVTHGFADPNQNKDGTFNVYISPRIQGKLREEILRHELGHVVMYATKFSPNEKGSNGILAEYTKWLDNQGHDTADLKQMLTSMKSPESAAVFIKAWAAKNGKKVGSLSDKNKEYIRSFDEWFADQVGKALKRNTPPRTIVQRFFSNIVNLLKKIFGGSSPTPPTNSKPAKTEIEKFVARLHQNEVATFDSPLQASLSSTFKEDIAKNDAWKQAKETMSNVLFDKDYNLRNLAGGKIDAFNELADRMFKKRGSTDVDNSYWHNKLLMLAKYDTHATNIMRGATREVQSKVMKELYNEKLDDKHALSRTVKIRGLFKDLKEYMEKEGIKVPTRKNYFPNIVNTEYTEAHHDEFIEMMERYPTEMEGISKTWNENTESRARYLGQIVDPKDLVSANDIPQMLYENIVRGDLMDEVMSEGQQTPHVRFLKHRVINFLKGNDVYNWKTNYLQHSVTDATATYITQAVKRVEYSKRFGKLNEVERDAYVEKKMKQGGKLVYSEEEKEDFEKESERTNRLESLLSDAKAEGATLAEIQHARDYVAAEMGTHGRNTALWLNEKLGIPLPRSHSPINSALHTATSTVMSLANIWVLGLSTITSLLDPIGIAVRSGSMSQALKSSVNGLKSAIGNDRNELMVMAEAIGSISDVATKEALAHGYNMVNMTPAIRRMNDKFFRIIGLEQWTKTTRLMAVDAAQGFIKRHDTNPNQHSERFLKELGLQKGDIKYGKNGKVKVLTYEEYKTANETEQARDDRVKSAIAEFVDTSILRPSPSQRPAWASDPHFALIFHLKSFMYSFQKTIINPLWNETKQGNYGPLLAMSAYIPAGIMVGLVKDIIKTLGDDDDDWTPSYKENWSVGDYILDGVEKSGLTGITQPIFDVQRSQKYGGSTIGGLFGPALEPWDTFNGLPVPLNYTWNNVVN